MRTNSILFIILFVELEIMLADGTEVTCSAAHEPDLFKAALCSLGIFSN